MPPGQEIVIHYLSESSCPTIKSLLVAFYHQRLTTKYDVEQYKLLEGFHSLMIDHVAMNPHDIFEARGRFNQRRKVEVWRDGLESRARSL